MFGGTNSSKVLVKFSFNKLSTDLLYPCYLALSWITHSSRKLVETQLHVFCRLNWLVICHFANVNKDSVEVGAIAPILHLRKLRLRKVMRLEQGQRVNGSLVWSQVPQFQVQWFSHYTRAILIFCLGFILIVLLVMVRILMNTITNYLVRE